MTPNLKLLQGGTPTLQEGNEARREDKPTRPFKTCMNCKYAAWDEKPGVVHDEYTHLGKQYPARVARIGDCVAPAPASLIDDDRDQITSDSPHIDCGVWAIDPRCVD